MRARALNNLCGSEYKCKDYGSVFAEERVVARARQNLRETLLTPAKVNVAKFGQWTRVVTAIANVRGSRFIPLGNG
jgi:hypothetical protein